MKHLIIASLLIIFTLTACNGVDEKAKYPEDKTWGEILTEESLNFKMLPLQPPSNDSVETARGLMRCVRLYIAYFTANLEACGLDEWETKNEGGFSGFVESKQFKECKHYDEYKVRIEYAGKFTSEAHRIADEEGFPEAVFTWHENRELNAYHEAMQRMYEKDYWELGKEEFQQEMEKNPLAADLLTCIDYRDYVDLKER